MLSNKVSAAFYIDGSCRPSNPGYIGWGIHGYLYSEQSPTPIVIDSFRHTNKGYISINHDLKDKIFDVKPIEYIDGLGSYSEMLSNNVAEFLALSNLLDYIKDKNLGEVNIHTDSEYIRLSINDWCPKWVKNGWLKQDGTEINNRKLIEKTYNVLKDIKSKGTIVNITWIRSHNGHIGNERADVLAGIGGGYSKQKVLISNIESLPAKGYWKSEAERNPYVAFRRLYFNSVVEYNKPGVYHLTESTDPDFIIGKATPSTGYSVVYLNEPDKIIEEIKNKQFEVSNGINAIILMKLDSVYNRNIYPWISEHGGKALISKKYSHSLSLVNQKPITIEQNPTNLSQRTLDYLALIEEFLAGFEDHVNSDSKWLIGANEISILPITDKFFINVTNGKGIVKQELKPEIGVGIKYLPMQIDIEHNGKTIPVKIPYVLGYDCLPRNNLKYLEGKNPEMYLLTWKENEILRYATIIRSTFGIGIWSNYFANQVVLPALKH